MKNSYGQARIRKLQPGDTVSAFDCGDSDLNDFILEEAANYREALLAVTYILEDEEQNVLAYFSLANDRVSLSDFETKTEFNRFRKNRFVNGKRIKSYPAAKICRLAVEKRAKGMHLGSYLVDFIKSYFVEDNKTGCRFLTVDAYAEAVPFYLRNEFVPLNDDDKDESTRLLFFDLGDID